MVTGLKNLVLSIFPPLRVAWRWTFIISPFLFLAICVGLFAVNEHFVTLVFEQPLYLLLILTGVWFWWHQVNGYSGLAGYRSQVSLWSRFILLALVAIVLARPRAAQMSKDMALVFVMDNSDSIDPAFKERALQIAMEYSSASFRKPTDEVGMVVFAQNAAVQMAPRPTAFFQNLAMNVRVEQAGTDIASALGLASAILPEDKVGRIVLMTDGAQTDGDLVTALDDLKARDIAVDVIPLNYRNDTEVWVEKLNLPSDPKVGQTYNAEVIISSMSDSRARLIVEQNGQAVEENDGKPGRDVVLSKGKNRFRVPFRLTQAGYYEFKAKIQRPEQEADKWQDQIADNNLASNYIFMRGEGTVLVVTDPDFMEANELDYQALVQSLKRGKMSVEEMISLDLPRDRLALMPYDCIIFVNVPRDSMDVPQMEAVRDAVRNMGVGLLMIGGPNSLGPGGYHRTPIEEALPVSMDVKNRKIIPKAAMAIILHTCEFPDGNTWAKRITLQAVKVLNSRDDVGVLAFDWNKGDFWVSPMQPAGNLPTISRQVNQAPIEDMLDYLPTMKMALTALTQNNAASRHLIIISDGDASPPDTATLNAYVKNKITISCVEIFPHGWQGGAQGGGTMQNIANVTGGKHYLLNKAGDANKLPSIFIKEAKTLKRSLIQERTVSLKKDGVDDTGILKGITAMPSIHGYVLTTPKDDPGVRVLLTAPDEKKEEFDPVLATWRYGLGQAGVWTSDFSPKWGKDMLNWGDFEAFTKQFVQSVSRTNSESHLRMKSYATANEGVIIVEDHHEQDRFMELVAQVALPNEETLQVQLRQIGPRRYEARFPIKGDGQYQITVGGKSDIGSGGGNNEEMERTHGGFIISYSPEYGRFRSNPIVMNKILERTGGREIFQDDDEALAQLFKGIDRQARISSRPSYHWFMIALCIWLVMDVAVRRIQIDWAFIGAKLGLNRQAKSTKTLGSLVAKKRELDARLKRQESERGAAFRPTGGARPPVPVSEDDLKREAERAAEETKKKNKTKAKKEAPKIDTTTSRLLDAKRKRQEGD